MYAGTVHPLLKSFLILTKSVVFLLRLVVKLIIIVVIVIRIVSLVCRLLLFEGNEDNDKNNYKYSGTGENRFHLGSDREIADPDAGVRPSLPGRCCL